MYSLMTRRVNGYYDDNGIWKRTKFCFAPCHDCTCAPPNGQYYSLAHDKTRVMPHAIFWLNVNVSTVPVAWDWSFGVQ